MRQTIRLSMALAATSMLSACTDGFNKLSAPSFRQAEFTATRGSVLACAEGAPLDIAVTVDGEIYPGATLAAGECAPVFRIARGPEAEVILSASHASDIVIDSAIARRVHPSHNGHETAMSGTVSVVASPSSGVIVTFWGRAVPALTWTLESVPGENISSIWASGPDDVFSSGGFRTLNRFDGTGWSTMAHPSGANRYHVFGIAPDAVWSSGQWGVIRYDGTTWHSMPSTGGGEQIDVWAAATDAVFVSGDGTLQRWNGSAWENLPTGLPTGFADTRLEGVWGTGPTNVYAVGWHGAVVRYDGTAVTRLTMPALASYSDVHGTGPDDVWVVGNNGVVLHFDGSAWTRVDIGSNAHFSGVWAGARNLVYVASSEGLHRWDGSTWQRIDTGFSGGFSAVFGVTPDLIYLGRNGPGAVVVGRR